MMEWYLKEKDPHQEFLAKADHSKAREEHRAQLQQLITKVTSKDSNNKADRKCGKVSRRPPTNRHVLTKTLSWRMTDIDACPYRTRLCSNVSYGASGSSEGNKISQSLYFCNTRPKLMALTRPECKYVDVMGLIFLAFDHATRICVESGLHRA